MDSSWTNQHLTGMLPFFVQADDPRPAKEQIAERYPFGWNNFAGATLKNAEELGQAQFCYPGDPPFTEIARTLVNNEWVILFPFDWVVCYNRDTGDIDVARID